MLISIIVPIYNVEKFLVRCIESLLCQTYQNFEIILVDDGSPDNSILICNRYAINDSRVKIIRQQNKGLSGARNTGLAHCKGEYVCFIDADDKVDSEMLDSYNNIIVKHTPDIITTNIYQYFRGNTAFVETRNNLLYNSLLIKDQIIKYFIEPFYGGYLGVIPSACTKLYRTEFLRKYHLTFNEKLKRSEDYWFNFFAFQKAELVYALDKSFYHYYATEGSMIKSFREGQFDVFLKNRFKLLDEHQYFSFPINWKELNNQFVRNINELILLEINVKGVRKAYKNIHNYLTNVEFLKIYKNSHSTKKHVKIIRLLLMKNKTLPAILIYYIWSFKAK